MQQKTKLFILYVAVGLGFALYRFWEIQQEKAVKPPITLEKTSY